MLQGDSTGRRTVEDESVRGIIWATALGFVALVVIWMGVAALVLGFEPLFALAYAFSYGSFAAVVLVVLVLILWLLIASGKSTIRAIRRQIVRIRQAPP
jgi:apolipoprotein N-acyltransferase